MEWFAQGWRRLAAICGEAAHKGQLEYEKLLAIVEIFPGHGVQGLRGHQQDTLLFSSQRRRGKSPGREESSVDRLPVDNRIRQRLGQRWITCSWRQPPQVKVVRGCAVHGHSHAVVCL
jgi:hypothetical protein